MRAFQRGVWHYSWVFRVGIFSCSLFTLKVQIFLWNFHNLSSIWTIGRTLSNIWTVMFNGWTFGNTLSNHLTVRHSAIQASYSWTYTVQPLDSCTQYCPKLDQFDKVMNNCWKVFHSHFYQFRHCNILKTLEEQHRKHNLILNYWQPCMSNRLTK